MNRALLLVVLILFAVSAVTSAQTTRTNQAKPNPAKGVARKKPATDPEAVRIRNERRAQAQSLLISLAADAGSYKDQKLRARTQARIADLLWDSDHERARTLFRKAWDAAEIADQESRLSMKDEIERREDGSVANEVLRMASRRDRALGEEFLTKQKATAADDASAATDNTKRKRQDTPPEVKRRLSLAQNLLKTDVKKAIQVADPALVIITPEGIMFLTFLREKDRLAADRRYTAMLTIATGNLQADANTVSVLSSYLFSPHSFITVHDSNETIAVIEVEDSGERVGRTAAPSADDLELRMAFFRIASEILLRPVQTSLRPDQSTATRNFGTYLVIKRLLPQFEQFAPQPMTEALRAQMNALSATMPKQERERDGDAVREGPQQKREDREKAILDRIDHAKTSEERDELYLNLALLWAEDGDLRARDYVDKIEDTDVRKNVRAWLDAVMISAAVDKKDVNKILELVRTGEITHLRKVWAFAQAAKLLAKTDPDKSSAVIEEATVETRRIDGSDADRPRALMAVANALLITDRSKSWDATYDGVKAANSAENFTGEDGELRIVLRTKKSGGVEGLDVPDFDVAGIFNELARVDYNRAVELARGFEREAPRANAVIAIARAVLEEKPN